MGPVPEAETKGAVLNEEEEASSKACQNGPLYHFLLQQIQKPSISALLELLPIHRLNSLNGVKCLMGAKVCLLVHFLEGGIFAVDEVDKDNAGDADDGEGGQDDQSHGPSETDRNGSSTGEHGEEIEHAAYLLPRGLLVGQCIFIELGGEFKLVVLVEPSDVLAQEAVHVCLPALDGQPFAQDGPAGEGDPGAEEGSDANVEKYVAVVDGVVEPLLGIGGVEEGIEDLPPQVGKPRKAASCNHGEDDSQGEQDVFVRFCKAKQLKQRNFIIFLLLLLLLALVLLALIFRLFVQLFRFEL